MINWLIPFLIFIVIAISGWRSPRVGLLLTVLAVPAYLIKFNIGTIPTTLTEVMLWAVLVGWLVRDPVSNFKQLVAAYHPIRWSLGLLVVGLIIGVAVAGDLRTSLGIVKGWFVDPIIFYGLVITILRIQYVYSLVIFLLISTLPMSVMALIQVITRDFITADGRASAWFASGNYLALYLVPILLLGFQLLIDPSYRRPKPFYWSIAVPGILAVYFSYSYGGWLALVVGALIIGIWRFRRQWQFWAGGGLAVVIAGLTQIGSARVAQMLDFTAQSSASVRLQVWAADLLMIKEKWLTGIGLGQYVKLYPQYIGRLFAAPLEPSILHAHNLYLHFLINLGIFGLAGFIGMIIQFFQWVKRAPLFWAIPLTAAMGSILTHGLVDTPYWKNDLSILVWLLLAAAYLTSVPKHD